ncbi:MAG: beta-ketoacyl synthase, partial [Capnocytophaga sp.]|nr:beta-ketoacyl synthase [Capnocytophaga sp.]
MFFTEYNIVTPLGFDLVSTIDAVLQGQSGIAKHPTMGRWAAIPLSKIDDKGIAAQFVNTPFKGEFSRLEQLLLLAVQPLLPRIAISPRTAFILSTTKGNINHLSADAPLPYLSTLAHKIATQLGVTSQPIVLSNACVSGAMALSVADRLLKAGAYDNAIVLAGDEISAFVLSGFQSFQAISAYPCKPYSPDRDGITLGEAIAVAYVTCDPQGAKAQLLGSASINDAAHISAPSRTGEGLYQSVQRALQEAQLRPEQIQLINAHGTGTRYNDEMESHAFSRAQLLEVPL